MRAPCLDKEAPWWSSEVGTASEPVQGWVDKARAVWYNWKDGEVQMAQTTGEKIISGLLANS